MPLISTSFPNLNGGVSQQPSTQRLENQCEAQENALPLVIGGLVKRPPTEHIGELKQSGGAALDLENAFNHFIQRDENEKYLLTIKGNGEVNVFNLEGNHETVYYAPSYGVGASNVISYFSDAVADEHLRAVTIGDVTWMLNTGKTVAMDAATSTASPNAYEALLWVRSSGQGIRFRVTIKPEGVPEEYIEVEHNFDATVNPTNNIADVSFPRTQDITEILEDGTVGSSVADTTIGTGSISTGIEGITNITCVRDGNVLYIHSPNDFQITVEDSLGNTAHKLIKNEAVEFSDLPPVAYAGQIIKVSGTPESDVDDYYVKFECNDPATTGMGSGLWFEAVAPGIPYKFDSSTMPHVLIRQPNNTWILKPADGTTPGANAHADLASLWPTLIFTNRQTGSELTNPLPSFVGSKISDIAYFKGRLCLLSGENVALSEAGEFFNYFRTTVSQLLDSAPIDVGVGGTDVNNLTRASAFSDRLVLFSERAQFILQGLPILSPMTATVTRATTFNAAGTCAPVPAGNALFFPFSRGAYSGVREFYKTNETDINFDAIEATLQVPRYIQGDIEAMTASNHEDIMVIRAGVANTLYAYKFFRTAAGRIQAAWFTMIFPEANVLHASFLQQSLYMVVKRGTQSFLEKMNLQTGRVDDDSTYVTHLDKRIKVTGNGAEPAAAGTTINLQNTARPDYVLTTAEQALVQVATQDGEQMTIDSATATTITLKESFEADAVFYIGLPYTMRYELTKPTFKQARNNPNNIETISIGRHQLRYMTVVYEDTAYFKVKITPRVADQDGTTLVYPFSGRFLSTGGFLGQLPSADGKFRFPVFAESDSVRIEIENDSPFPSSIQSVQFEAQYTTRSQRV